MTGSNLSAWRSRSSTPCPPFRKISTTRACSAETKLVSRGCAKTTRMRTASPSGRLGGPHQGLVAPFGGDEKFNARGGEQHLPDFFLEHPVGVCDPFAQMHEFEPRLDEIGFLVAANIACVLEDSPGERAVAAPLEPELLERAQEGRAVLWVDPIFDLHQDRPATVVDLLKGLRQAPMLGRRKVGRGSSAQPPTPRQGNRDERARGGAEKRGRKSDSRRDFAPGCAG